MIWIALVNTFIFFCFVCIFTSRVDDYLKKQHKTMMILDSIDQRLARYIEWAERYSVES